MARIEKSFTPNTADAESLKKELRDAGVDLLEVMSGVGNVPDLSVTVKPTMPIWHLSYEDSDAKASAKVAELVKAFKLQPFPPPP